MKKVFIYMFAIASFICACTETEMWNEKMNSKSISDDVTIEAVKKSAMDFINDLKPITRGESFDIASVYAWRSADAFSTSRVNGEEELPDTALYIVNFTNNNGYLLLSAVDPAHEVVAYVEEGNMTPNRTIDNPGFKLFLEGLKEHITRFDPVGPGVPDTTLITMDTTQVGIGPTPAYGYEWRIDSMAPKLLSTKWGQFYPYNMYCFTNTGEQAVAGCVAIAGAQLMAYYQYPSSYNNHIYYWNNILDGEEPVSALGKESVARLVNDIGVLIFTQYGVNGSSAHAYDLANCWNNMGYTYQYYAPYDYESCVQEFRHFRPVVMKGERENNIGHCWVIDGFIARSLWVIRQYSQHVVMRQNLVHCNWGWNGQQNGYFLHNAFNTANQILTDSLTAPGTSNINRNYDHALYVFYGVKPL